LIPNPDPLPVAPGWFSFLSYLTYFFHFIAVGVMFGASLFSVMGHLKGKHDEKWKMFGYKMSKILPFTIAAAVNLGVAPLLFLQVLHGNFFYPASIIIGIPWLLLIPILIAAYYSAYGIAFKKKNSLKRKSFLSVTITALLAWVGFMLVNVNTLMMVPGRWNTYFSSMSGMNLNLSEATLYPRFLLYIFLFLTIGGMFTALFYKIKHKAEEASLGFHFGSTSAGYFGILTIPLFIYFLLSLPAGIKNVFLGGSAAWLLLSLIFVLSLLISAVLNFKRKTITSLSILAAGLVIFVLIRNHIRHLYLEPFAEKFATLSSSTQYDVLVLFFFILALGLILVTWLLAKTAKEYKNSPRN
jgi:hypothetical protein